MAVSPLIYPRLSSTFHELFMTLRTVVALVESGKPRVLDPIIPFRRYGKRLLVECTEDVIKGWSEGSLMITVINRWLAVRGLLIDDIEMPEHFERAFTVVSANIKILAGISNAMLRSIV
jgi:hypothetical protein